MPWPWPKKSSRLLWIVTNYLEEVLTFITFYTFLSCIQISRIPGYPSTGAIFSEEQKDTSIELAFKYAVYKINKDRNILPKTTLVYDIQYVPDSTDSFRTSKKVCKSIENGVTAIFGK